MCRGNGASVLRIVPYAALHFSAYEYYRDALARAAAAAAEKPLDAYLVPPSLDLLAGSAAGATAVLVGQSTKACLPQHARLCTTAFLAQCSAHRCPSCCPPCCAFG